jgi:hypothetical protein
MFLCGVHTVKAQKSSRRANKPTEPNALGVKTGRVSGGSFSSRTRIEAEHLKSAARWST